ncbi:MAG TPA: hypothetical protein VK166_01225 [Chitinophagaceae bacterium]|nr:hypothetical protein [Chitinophagaceae bacterium]
MSQAGVVVLFAGLLFSSCQKEVLKAPATVENLAANSSANTLTMYQGLSPQTMWELQQARAATARYKNIRNAIADGYEDIAVNVENMGHHFMKKSQVDAAFDMKQPEILVYNKDENGAQQLVAVEYAIPLGNPRPEGFSGSNDVWDGNTGFGLWLLHAWVWSYNPSGVFNSTNPLVHLH